MPFFTDAILQSGAHAWIYLPIAILLGALHGLEPGHSKTMMAAFIVAVRGTVGQATLLGISAAISHTAVVWVVALGGQYLLRGNSTQAIEPYFQIASAVLVLAIAGWILWSARANNVKSAARHDHMHPHVQANSAGLNTQRSDHHHEPEVRRIETGHGMLVLEIFGDGVPPRWRARFEGAPPWATTELGVVTRRPDGDEQLFAFDERDGYLESVEAIPEPHAFAARVSFGHGDHIHAYELEFAEPESHNYLHYDHHGHDGSRHGHDNHHHDHAGVLAEIAAHTAGMNAHERAHAREISGRFTGHKVSTGQIVAFGLTGGLIPCPAAITVLLLCLQVKRIALAVALVLCFSIGVAATMVAAGVVAAMSVRHVRERWPGFDALGRRAPYASSVLMVAIGLYVGLSGWLTLLNP